MSGQELINKPEADNPNVLSHAASGPLVSIITPVLNGKRYIEQCIQSILEQSYPHIEHVLVDGGSSDGTLDILKSHSQSHPQRVRYMTGSDRNAEDAWNKGLILSKGDILGWLGADDTFTPDAIRIVVDFFKSNVAASFLFGACNVIDAEDRLITQIGTRDFDMQEALDTESPIPTPAAFYKREVVARVGLLDSNLHPGDFEYWLRIARVFQLFRTREVLANFRLHAGGVSGSPGIERRYAYVTYKTSRRYGGRVFSRRGVRYCGLLVRDYLGPIYPPLRWLVQRLRGDKQ